MDRKLPRFAFQFLLLLGVGPSSSSPSLIQTCIAGNYDAPSVCSTTSNSASGGAIANPVQSFTSGQTLVVYVTSTNGSTLPLVAPNLSGSGCPSSLTAWVPLTGAHGLYYGTTQAGACTVTESAASSAAYTQMAWWVWSGLTGSYDTPSFIDNTGCFSTNCPGASETPSANNSAVMGSVTTSGSGSIIGLNSGSPFSLTPPNQFNAMLALDNLAVLAASFVQSTAASAQIGYTNTSGVAIASSVVASAR